MNSKHLALALFAGLAFCGFAASAKELQADALTRTLLQPAEFELIAISPDGTKLALSRRVGDGVKLVIHQRSDMKQLSSFTPGARGEITNLAWLDDSRLLVGMTRLGGPANPGNLARFAPILVVADLNGERPLVMDAEPFAIIEGDRNHLLVKDCGPGPGNKGCSVPQIRRIAFDHLTSKGDLVLEGPPESLLEVNESASAGFAIHWEDDDTGKTYVYQPADKTWKLINDGSATGLEVVPAYVTRDGKTGYLISQRKSGPNVVEKYDFATGTRTELYADPTSDPLSILVSLDGNEAIGAYYDATDPKPHFWSPAHPDAQMGLELQAAFPGERVRQLDHSKDGNVVILGVSSDHDRGSWYEFDRKAGKVSKITKRAPWLDAAKQGTQTAFELAARDGLPLHGVLTLPPASTGKNLPLVVVPHGGPFGVSDRKGYDLDDQILAQHGYAVLQLNFRGSSDYGRAFVAAGARQWGAAMQDDLTDATRWAIAQGIADPQRICIYGMSYGGYAALMAPIREPGLYKCAASYAGPSDLTRMTKWGNARRTELSKKWHVKMLGEPATLASVSPALNADKIKVPVLLAHGIVDSRVDIRHTQAMRRELEKNGTPVDYVEYSATGHWLYDEHREDFYARLLRLLDANIGAGARPAGQATAAQ